MIDSNLYWENRYAKGGNSGSGSYGKLAEFKAEVINRFAKEHGIRSVIEFGCGDGEQLRVYEFKQYIGFDVSETVVSMCREKYKDDKSKRFLKYPDELWMHDNLTMSIDVLFHITDFTEFFAYLNRLFEFSLKYVIIYAYDHDVTPEDRFQAHYQPRKFTGIIEEMFPQWKLIEHIPNKYPVSEFGPAKGSYSEFYIYEKK